MLLVTIVCAYAVLQSHVRFYGQAAPVPDLYDIVAAIPGDFVRHGFLRFEERVLGVLKKLSSSWRRDIMMERLVRCLDEVLFFLLVI